VGERVVITGLGAVTPLGAGITALSHGLRQGLSGVGPLTSFDCTGFDVRIAAQVDDADADLGTFIEQPKLTKHMSRAALFGAAAAAMARRAACLGRDDVDPLRLGVSLGVGGMGPVDLDMLAGEARAVLEAARESGSFDFDIPAFAKAYRAMTNPIAALRGLPNLAASHLSILHDARGPSNTLATACTAGTQAVGEGARLIRSGAADVVLAGGTDAMINPVGVLGFSMLGTLSRRNDDPTAAARPFERDRDGFVIGEGAGVVLLEREAFARARNAPILAEVAGYAATSDAYRITDERPDAFGAASAIRLCLADAGVDPEDVDYVNAHGTGTVMNDITETRAIKQTLGAHASSVPVSSTKSMMGHVLAAAGAVEAIICVLAMTEGFLPPTLNYHTPDPECDLDCVANTARPARIELALSNSFGFGGQNACLLIRRR
jgi:3-oxoacyl-[acyl-carrier-protein] synthase II